MLLFLTCLPSSSGFFYLYRGIIALTFCRCFDIFCLFQVEVDSFFDSTWTLVTFTFDLFIATALVVYKIYKIQLTE